MATKKISELEAISEAASDDVLAIVDVSETETRKITKGNLLVGAGHTIEMSLNSTTYTLTLSLKNEAGTVLNTQTIDLPNENALTNITYSNGILTLTKQNSETSTVDISGLVSGLLSETTFNAFVTEIEEIIGISTDTYRTTSTYNTGDIVIYNGKIYKCNNNNVTGTFDDTKWDEISLYEYQKLQDQKIENKVEKENGKGLSTNDYTTAEKNKLSGIETGAEVNIIETVKVNGTALTPTNKEVDVPVPTKTSDLTNDSGFGTYTKPSGGIPKTDLASDVQTSLGKADSALQEHQDISGKEDSSNKVIELTEESTDIEYPSAKAVYDELESVKAENEGLKSEVEEQQKILSQMPKVPGEGTEFTLNNTIEAEFAEFLPGGNTEQETTTGKQKLQNTATSQTVNGVVFTVNQNGTVKANGTANSNAILILNVISLQGSYILNGCPEGGSSSKYKVDLQPFGGGDPIPDYGNGAQIELSESASFNVRIVIYSGTTVNNLIFKPMLRFSNILDDRYEKYTGGIASPNVDYPSERYSAGGNVNEFDKDIEPEHRYYNNSGTTTTDNVNNFINQTIEPTSKNLVISYSEKIGTAYVRIVEFKKNGTFIRRTLLSENNATLSLDNECNYYIASVDAGPNVYFTDLKIEKGTKASPYTPYGKGCITQKIVNKNWFDGVIEEGSLNSGQNATASTSLIRSKNYSAVTPNTQFAFSVDGTLNKVVMNYYDINKNWINTGAASGELCDTGIFTTPENAHYVRFRCYAADYNLFSTGNIQIELGSTATPYTEHKEQTYTIPVQQEMRSIKDSNGNVIAKDEFIEKDGVKYVRHNIARVVFDGTETWVYDSTYKYFRCSTYVFDKEPKEGQEPQYSNQFVVTNDWGNTFRNQTTVNMMFHLTSGGYRVCIRNTNYDTPAGFANWLAEQYANGTPVYVDYIPTEPTDLPCTEAQITALESMPDTYTGQTNVLSEDNVPANVKASGYLDLNSLVTRVAQLETEV